MLRLLPFLLVGLLAVLNYRHFRGRTVESLIRRPPPGSDLNTVVGTLSYLEHELIKHRIPVLRSLVAKPTWNRDDWRLLDRTIGSTDASLLAEFRRYLDGLQRGAGRALVNFDRDRPFHRARRLFQYIQHTGERWLKSQQKGAPSADQRHEVEVMAAWLAVSFRRYLVELGRSVYRCEIAAARLSAAAKRGLAEADGDTVLTVGEPPHDCAARILSSDLDIVVRNLVRNAAQAPRAEGRQSRVHVDVAEEMDITGEESVLIRIHDNCPQMLTRGEIYGREAQRGLGLVTQALTRHQGAVHCEPSDEDGFDKAMVVRLSRSLHQPNADALRVARARRVSIWLPVVSAVLCLGLIPLALLPVMSGSPVNLALIEVPNGCWHRAAGPFGHSAIVHCPAMLNTEPRERTEVVLNAAALANSRVEVVDSGCADVDLSDSVIRVHLERCLAADQLEPRITFSVDSGLLTRPVAFELQLAASTGRVMAVLRAAADRGDTDRARWLANFLTHLPPNRIQDELRADAYFHRARATIVDGLRLRLSGSMPTCADLQDVEQARVDLSRLDSPNRFEDMALYLASNSELWLRADLVEARLHFEALRSSQSRPMLLQSGRVSLALLSLSNPSEVSVGRELHALVETLMSSGSGDGSGDRVQLLTFEASTTEVLCALSQVLPIAGASDVTMALQSVCPSELESTGGHITELAALLRQGLAPLSCRR